MKNHMNGIDMKRGIRRILECGVTILALVSLGGCGDDEHGSEGSSDAWSSGHVHSIKLYIEQEDGSRELIEVSAEGRQEESGASSEEEAGATAETGEGVRERSTNLTIRGEDEEGNELDDDDLSKEFGIQNLAIWAARACQFEMFDAPDGMPGIVVPGSESDAEASTMPWQSFMLGGQGGYTYWGRLWVFHKRLREHQNSTGDTVLTRNMTKCDDMVRFQGVALCAADKLLKAASAVGADEWRVDMDSFSSNRKFARVVVPPQSTRDRHILYQVAMGTLASIAHVGYQTLHDGDAEGLRCDQVYKGIIDDEQDELENEAFYQSIFPLPGLPYESVGGGILSPEQLAESRVAITSEHYRAAGRLLREATESYVDLTLEQSFRGSFDPTRLWAASPEESGVDSLRASLARLWGRLEVDPLVSTIPSAPSGDVQGLISEYLPARDPQCAGYASLRDRAGEEDLVDALGKGFKGRFSDRPPTTASQALALSLVEELGITVSKEQLRTTSADLKAVLKQQLVLDQALRMSPGNTAAELVGNGTYATALSDRGVAIDARIASISNEDIRFAIERNVDAIAQLIDEEPEDILNPNVAIPVLPKAGIGRVTRDMTGTLLSSLNGAILSASDEGPIGIPRWALGGDMTARMGGAMAASQCAFQSKPVINVHQDPIALARAYGELLNNLTTEESLPFSTEETIDLARHELAQWGGTEGFNVRHLSSNPGSRREVTGELSLEKLGVESAAEFSVQAPLAMIYGEPWEADCLAGVRTVCPDSFVPSKLLEVRSGTFTASTSELSQGHVSFLIEFLDGSGISNQGWNQKFGSKLLYLVQKPGKAQGRVLGAVRPSTSTLKVHLSEYRRQKTNEIFGVAEKRSSGDSCIETSSSALPASFCLSGMNRDMYVPLANELTSQAGGAEDSWRHYLNLAKEAASEADELGRQIIDLGLQRDLRREGAQEKLAGLCGSYTEVSDLAFEQNRVSSGTDEGFNSCANLDRVDVLFLGAQKNDEHPEAIVREEYCVPYESVGRPIDERICDAAATNGGFASAGIGVRYLGFQPPAGEDGSTGVDGCDRILGNDEQAYDPEFDSSLTDRWIQAGYFDGNTYAQSALTSAFSGAGLTSALDRYRFVEHPDSSWELQRNGEAFLAGGPTTRSPALSAARHTAFPYCDYYASWSSGSSSDRCSATGKALRDLFGLNASADEAFSKRLRRIVEGGLWHMAVLTGHLPAGTFTLQLPATNFSGSTPPADAYYPTVYSKSGFVALVPNPVGDASHRYVLESNSYWFPDDGARFGEADTRSASFWSQKRGLYDEGAIDAEENPWLNVYARAELDTQSYLVVEATNDAEDLEELTSDAGGTTAWLERAGTRSVRATFYADALRPKKFANRPSGSEPVFKSGSLSRYLVASDGWGASSSYRQPSDYLDAFEVTCSLDVPFNAGAWQLWLDSGSSYEELGIQDYYRPNLVTRVGYRNSSSQPHCRVWQQSGTDYMQGHHLRSGGKFVYEAVPEFLSARAWPPSRRVHLFVDAGGSTENGIVGAGLLSCLAQDQRGLQISSAVPVLNKVSQIPNMRRWIEQQSAGVAEEQRRLFLINIPGAVVDYFSGSVPLQEAVGMGEQGDRLLYLANAIQNSYDGFTSVSAGFRQMAASVESAELVVASAEVNNDQALSSVALSRANAVGQLASSLSQASLGVFGGFPNPAAMASSAISGGVGVASALASLDHANQSEGLIEEGFQNQVAMALQQMGEGVATGRDQADSGISQIKTSLLDGLVHLNALQRIASQASVEAAKAAGADFADLDGDGKGDVALPVNTVYRRNYDVTRLRYERALESAKRFAYLARLSIEQRLGVRMDTLDEEFGPIPPPSGWANDVCSLQGVDYAALREANPESGGVNGDSEVVSEEEVIGEFADQYIGDYVARLEEFVEYYNIKYPFHEEDDTVVLSLRDDLLYGATDQRAVNLLYRSELLDQQGSAQESSNPEVSAKGWKRTACRGPQGSETLGACLSVAGESYVGLGPDGSLGTADDVLGKLIPPNGLGRGTILRATAVATEGADSGTVPPVSIYQTIWLEKGAYYRLSWWDMARSSSGGRTSSDQSFRVRVTNEAWSPVALEDFDAPGTNTDDEWSGRRQVDFFAIEDGFYHVVFAPTIGSGVGAIAVANVQLEVAEGEKSAPYESVADDRRAVETNLRSAFERICVQNGCYYELAQPFFLRSGAIADGSAQIPGLAADNYNYRHEQVAVNVVGTGILGCEGSSQGCYSNGYVEYDLIHSAFDAELTDYAGEARCFSFGEAAIRHGKGLAAERYLGVPLGSSDAALIEQPAFMKTTFTGRPLSGAYRLRIFETPSLRWDNIEDIQLVLKYGYWSRVARAAN